MVQISPSEKAILTPRIKATSYDSLRPWKVSKISSAHLPKQIYRMLYKSRHRRFCATFSKVCNESNTTSDSEFEKIIERSHVIADVGLRFVLLDKSTHHLALFTEASFANAKNLKSHIGFALVLADGSDNANKIHYGSSRCKHVTRSVMASEIHDLMYVFDNAHIGKGIL